MDKKQTEKMSAKSKKRFLAAISVLLLMTILLISWKYFGRLKAIRIENFTNSLELEKKPQVHQEKFVGKYFAISHPSLFEVKFHEKEIEKNGKYLEKVLLAEKTSNSKKIAITISWRPQNLLDDANYKLRQTYSRKYKAGKFKSEAVEALTFSVEDKNYYEKTFFILGEDYLATLSFSVFLSSGEKLEQEADALAGSFSWQEDE